MKKIILIWILALLSILPFVNAVLFSFDYTNLTGGTSELKKIDWGNSTAFFNFADNVTSMGYQYLIKYDNEPTATFTQVAGTLSVVASNLEGNQMKIDDPGQGTAEFNPASTEINMTAYAFLVNYDNPSSNTMSFIPDGNSPIIGNGDGINTAYIGYYDGGWAATTIRQGSTAQTDYIFAKIDSAAKRLVINNMSQNGYYDAIKTTTTVFTDKVTFQGNTDVEALMDVVRVVNQSPNFNTSANVARFSRQRFDKANNSYEIYVMSKVPEANLILVYSISCNNGTNWVNVSTSPTDNKTTAVCYNNQLSHDFLLAVYNWDSNSNWTAVYVDGGIATSNSLPPEITFYNMTSEGGEGCTNWNTDKNTACTTSDTTPTVFIRTDPNANCRIGVQNLNYTNLSAGRECTGGGSTQLTCTLTAQDELAQETSYLYIGCKDIFGNENLTSTSGALKISIPTLDLETNGRNAIETGIQHALSGEIYTVYTGQKVYARNSANSQFVSTFDKVVKKLNKIWAVNILTGNDTSVNVFNITPVLYALEMQNASISSINQTVYNLITSTK